MELLWAEYIVSRRLHRNRNPLVRASHRVSGNNPILGSKRSVGCCSMRANIIGMEAQLPDPNLNEEVTLSLSRAACLVLFELLTTSYEVWRRDNPSDSSALPMVVEGQSHSQRAALWQLEGSIERTLPELFSSNYEQLLQDAKSVLDVPNQ